jgi:hypothetical protein
LSLQGFAFRTTAEAGSGFFATAGFSFGVTTAGASIATAFGFRGGGL